MLRKGQLTQLILVGLFMLTVLLVGLYYVQKTAKTQMEREYGKLTNVDFVKSYVTECLKESGEDAFTLLGSRGGFIAVPWQVQSINIGGGNFMYLVYDRGVKYIQEIETTEAEVSMFVEQKIQDCFETEDFVSYGRRVEYVSAPLVTTTIGDENVLIKMYQPIEVREDNGDLNNLEEFAVNLPIRYGLVVKTVRKISDQLFIADLKREMLIEERVNNRLFPTQPPISLNFMYYNDYPEGIDVKFYFYDGPVTLWKVTDTNSTGGYNFIFAANHMIKDL